MKKILIILFLFKGLFIFGQTDLENAPYSKFIETKSDTFLIGSKNITNREYIIYLLWLQNTYGASYPENIIYSFPGISSNKDDLIMSFYDSKEPINLLIKQSPEYVRDYIFNSKYSDYPIIGITWKQANKFLKWLTDRYNENKLIENKILQEDFKQFDENCFVTESYLSGQYYNKFSERKVEWKDRLLIPSFRLPSKTELVLSKNEPLRIGSVNYNKNNFLRIWDNKFLKIRNDSYIFLYIDGEKEVVPSKIKFNYNEILLRELSLDEKNKSTDSDIIDIYDLNKQDVLDIKVFNQFEKDSIGHLPYIIIDENKNKEPIGVYHLFRNIEIKNKHNEFNVFRYACSMRRGQYIP